MTEADVIAHWRKGAQAELQSARLLFEGGQFPGALFHCHLAVEKAIKALYMQEHRKEAPFTHDLLIVALQTTHPWSEDEQRLLADLTAYAVTARYDDPAWAEREATPELTSAWIAKVASFLTSLFP